MALTDFARPMNGQHHTPHAAATTTKSSDSDATTERPPLSILDTEPEQQRTTAAQFADDGDDDGNGAMGFSSVADWIENALTETATETTQQNNSAESAEKNTTPPPTETVQINGKKDPLLGQTVEISADIYVEILEAVTASLAAWYSGDNESDFNFDKKLKERYKRVTELYAKTQNVEVSPGFLFFAFTVLVVGQVGFQAHKKKNKIIEMRAFRKKVIENNTSISAAQKVQPRQQSLFPTEQPQPAQIKIQKDNTYQMPESEYRRKDWQTQGGFYTRTPEGVYLKKTERKQKPSNELNAFFSEFYAVHLRMPSNKETKTYLQSIV